MSPEVIMKNTRKIIRINEELCDGCGLCVPDCAEGSLQIIDGKAKLVADKLCDGLGACLGSCPTGALEIIEREADEFDEEAVEEFLAAQKAKKTTAAPIGGGCPSAQLHTFKPATTPCQAANAPTSIPTADDAPSGLAHWPVQIRLIPPTAPFLQNADVLIAADCTAVAARRFQEKYLDGKVVMMGCPKFDDADNYIDRFTEILKSCNLKKITILIMEVPCCSSMNVILRQALQKSDVKVPVEQVTLSVQGEEIERKMW